MVGGIVVATDLNPWWVTAHFVAGLALIADVTTSAAASLPLGGEPDELGSADRARFAGSPWSRPAWWRSLLLVGTFVRASNAQLVFTDWPLMDGRLVPSFDAEGAIAMFTHRLLALGGVLVRPVDDGASQDGDAPFARRRDAVHAGVPLFVAQILSGAANVITPLKPWAVVAHVALSVLIWASLVALATVARRSADLSRHGQGRRRRRVPDPVRADAGSEQSAEPRSNRRSATRSRPTSDSRNPASSCCCSSRPCRR